MNSPARSIASRTSWTCLVLALSGTVSFIAFQVINGISPFETTGQGVLTGMFPRIVLCGLFAVEALAVAIGVASFLLVRQRDKTSKAIVGIVLRSVCGIVAGLCAGLVLWLVVGHIVIGF